MPKRVDGELAMIFKKNDQLDLTSDRKCDMIIIDGGTMALGNLHCTLSRANLFVSEQKQPSQKNDYEIIMDEGRT